MNSQLTFNLDVLTCCTLYYHCGYYLTPLVSHEHLNILNNNLALMAIYAYHFPPATPQSMVPAFLGSFS